MSSSSKVKVVTPRDADGTQVWDFRCPYPFGCGQDEPFSSVGWATRDLAAKRARQHIDEHETGEPMQELHAFRVDQGLTPDSAGETTRAVDWEF